MPGTGRYIGAMGLLVRAQVLARRPGPRIVIPEATPTTQQLEDLAALVTSGSVVPVIDRAFDLDDGADAVRYVETEHATAKVIITVRSDDPPTPTTPPTPPDEAPPRFEGSS